MGEKCYECKYFIFTEDEFGGDADCMSDKKCPHYQQYEITEIEIDIDDDSLPF